MLAAQLAPPGQPGLESTRRQHPNKGRGQGQVAVGGLVGYNFGPVNLQAYVTRDVAERMEMFGAWEVVNPLDRFGDHLRILLRSPAAYQLMLWLTSAPGTPLPKRQWDTSNWRAGPISS